MLLLLRPCAVLTLLGWYQGVESQALICRFWSCSTSVSAAREVGVVLKQGDEESGRDGWT